VTGYAEMASRGRAEARAATAGRRKVIAERIEYDSNIGPLPGVEVPRFGHVQARLVGACGHTLGWLAHVPVVDGEPQPPYYLTGKLGRRVTCPHDDCRIPAHVPSDADCVYVMGVEVERRCTTRARWDTPMGRVCTRHRNHHVREGYLAETECVPVVSGP
jgi:hypothetical protein